MILRRMGFLERLLGDAVEFVENSLQESNKNDFCNRMIHMIEEDLFSDEPDGALWNYCNAYFQYYSDREIGDMNSFSFIFLSNLTEAVSKREIETKQRFARRLESEGEEFFAEKLYKSVVKKTSLEQAKEILEHLKSENDFLELEKRVYAKKIDKRIQNLENKQKIKIQKKDEAFRKKQITQIESEKIRGDDVFIKIEKLKKLRDIEAISEEEFNKKREKLLRKI